MAVVRESPLLRFIRRIAAAGPNGPTDGQLLDQYLASGSESAFSALVHRHGPMVRAVCRRTLGNVHDADDAFQATFILLMRKAHRIVHRESVGSWLHGVAFRTALRARKARLHRREQEKLATVPEATEAAADIAWRELRPILDQEIDRLPEKYRLPFVLCYLEGKTNAEVAHQLRWPLGTVATRLARARQRLRKRLTRRGAVLAAGLLAASESRTAFAAAAALRGALCRVDLHGPMSGRATALAKGVMATMWMTKVRNVALAVFCGAALVGGAGALIQRFAFVDAEEVAGSTAATVGQESRTQEKSKNPPKSSQAKIEPEVCRVEVNLKDHGPDGEIEALMSQEMCLVVGQSGRVLIGQSWPIATASSVEPNGTVVNYQDIGLQAQATVTKSFDGKYCLDCRVERSEPVTEKGLGNSTITGQFMHLVRMIKLGETVQFEMANASSPKNVYKLEIRITDLKDVGEGQKEPHAQILANPIDLPTATPRIGNQANPPRPMPLEMPPPAKK